MGAIIAALLPVFLIILLGSGMRRLSMFDEQVWRGIENLCYYLLFPVLLVKTLATAELGASNVLLFSAALLFAIFAMGGVMLALHPLLRHWLGITPAAFTSLFQGATRWHGFIALSVVGLLMGEEGLAYMAITMAVIIPPLNIINIWVLVAHSERDRSLLDVALQLLRNPFIIACAVGGGLNVSGLGLSGPVYRLFDILGGGALGLGLLAVGAGLHFRLALDQKAVVLSGAMIRLIGMPALMFLGCWLFGVEGIPRTVAVLAGAVPTAASAFVLARQMGGDAPLMANLITVQVLAATVTLPVMIWLAG